MKKTYLYRIKYKNTREPLSSPHRHGQTVIRSTNREKAIKSFHRIYKHCEVSSYERISRKDFKSEKV